MIRSMARAVILHIQPVPDVQALAVHRQGLVVQGVGDHQGDQLLGEVVGPVVVGAAAEMVTGRP